MKIIEEKKEVKLIKFKDLKVGELFKFKAGNTENVFMKISVCNNEKDTYLYVKMNTGTIWDKDKEVIYSDVIRYSGELKVEKTL